jgi:hypothetical protein
VFVNSAHIAHGTQDLGNDGPRPATSSASTAAETSAAAANPSSSGADSSSGRRACHYGSALIGNKKTVAKLASTMSNIFLPWAKAAQRCVETASEEQRTATRRVLTRPFGQ